MVTKYSYLSRFSAAQGAGETRTETYFCYGEEALQPATPRCAKNISGVDGSAVKQADVARRYDEK
jgi:hypothetical protein